MLQQESAELKASYLAFYHTIEEEAREYEAGVRGGATDVLEASAVLLAAERLQRALDLTLDLVHERTGCMEQFGASQDALRCLSEKESVLAQQVAAYSGDVTAATLSTKAAVFTKAALSTREALSTKEAVLTNAELSTKQALPIRVPLNEKCVSESEDVDVGVSEIAYIDDGYNGISYSDAYRTVADAVKEMDGRIAQEREACGTLRMRVASCGRSIEASKAQLWKLRQVQKQLTRTVFGFKNGEASILIVPMGEIDARGNCKALEHLQVWDAKVNECLHECVRDNFDCVPITDFELQKKFHQQGNHIWKRIIHILRQ